MSEPDKPTSFEFVYQLIKAVLPFYSSEKMFPLFLVDTYAESQLGRMDEIKNLAKIVEFDIETWDEATQYRLYDEVVEYLKMPIQCCQHLELEYLGNYFKEGESPSGGYRRLTHAKNTIITINASWIQVGQILEMMATFAQGEQLIDLAISTHGNNRLQFDAKDYDDQNIMSTNCEINCK